MDEDHQAFLDATMPHLDAVYRVARGLRIPSMTADDLVQETYLRAFTHFPQFRGDNVRAWLATICLNVARSEARRRSRRPAEVPLIEDLDEAGPVDEVSERAIESFERAEIRSAMAELPEDHQLCILLMDVAGYTARETARILDCPRGTVLARVHRGRRRLARKLLRGRSADSEGGEVHRGPA